MAKRGENIYLRKDGRWEGRYIKGRKPDRKPIYGCVYAQKYSECKAKLMNAKSLHLHESSVIKVCGAGTVSDFIGYWLCGIIRQSTKESTFSNYTTISDKWITPFFGKKAKQGNQRRCSEFRQLLI